MTLDQNSYDEMIRDPDTPLPNYVTLDDGNTFNRKVYNQTSYCYMCKWCGAVVIDTGAHSVFHAEYAKNPPYWWKDYLESLKDDPTLR